MKVLNYTYIYIYIYGITLYSLCQEKKKKGREPIPRTLCASSRIILMFGAFHREIVKRKIYEFYENKVKENIMN